VYGAYTNGASIYSRERLMSLGNGHLRRARAMRSASRRRYSEANYATRVALKYPCSAMIRTRTDCELISCMGVFEHIGDGQSIMSAQTKNDLQRGGQNYFVGALRYATLCPLPGAAARSHACIG
jgi:hypothetical protein